MKTKFKGHETFFFREGWLSKAMFEIHANNNTNLFVGNNGIIKLGVGANMVKSIKYWLQASNLLTYNHNSRVYELSELGTLIAINDIYLEDMFTLWIIHINIVRNFSIATTWNLFFNILKADKFTADDVKLLLKTYLSSKEILYVDKSLDIDINLLLGMYTKINYGQDPEENLVCPLSNLGILKENRGKFIKILPNLNELNELVILYAIICLISDKQENTDIQFICISDLENSYNSLMNLFNINRVILNEYLERLANQGFLRIERTAGLDMIYMSENLTCNEVVRIYYERRGVL